MSRLARFPNAPTRIRGLPMDARGFPVPWFVHWDKGEPDFRIIGAGRFATAIRQKLCWICGGRLGQALAFTVGPMCVINRVSSEPPQHLDCARFAAVACPFLANPRMRRNEKDVPPDRIDPPGIHSTDNPGACAIYVTRSFHLFWPQRPGEGRPLIEMGEPQGVLWYREGQPASRSQALAALERGLPKLKVLADTAADPVDANRELGRAMERALATVPE